MIQFNIYNYTRQYLPARRRKEILLSYIDALLIPIVQLWYLFSTFRTTKIYEANLTAQTLSLQEHLNNCFDSQRRILITHFDQQGIFFPLTTEGYTGLFISLTNENAGVFIALDNEIETAIGVDFVVNVPATIFKETMRNEIETYKLADKTYKIELQ